MLIDEMTIESIQEKLHEIQRAGLELPPSQQAVAFNPAATEHEVHLFEARNGVRLPEDFKRFLYEVGNGGFGPGRGILALGDEMLIDPRIPVDLPHAIDARTEFAYINAWNYEPLRIAMEQNSLDKDAHMEHYFSVDRIAGSLRVADWGGGGLALLVVNGQEYGKLWSDYRGDFGGIFPETRSADDAEHLTFGQWYEAWLDEILHEVPLDQRRFW